MNIPEGCCWRGDALHGATTLIPIHAVISTDRTRAQVRGRYARFSVRPMSLHHKELYGNAPAYAPGRGGKQALRKKEVYAGGEEWIGQGS